MDYLGSMSAGLYGFQTDSDALTWPTEPAVVIGVAAYCWTVQGPKALTLTERFELSRVLEVGPAVQFTHKQLWGCHMAAQPQLCPGNHNTVAGHPSSGLHRLQ